MAHNLILVAIWVGERCHWNAKTTLQRSARARRLAHNISDRQRRERRMVGRVRADRDAFCVQTSKLIPAEQRQHFAVSLIPRTRPTDYISGDKDARRETILPEQRPCVGQEVTIAIV